MLPPSLPYLSGAHAPGEKSNTWVSLIVCVRVRKGFKVDKEQEKIQTSRIKFLSIFFKQMFKGFALWGADFLKMPTIMCLCVSVRMGGWIKRRQKVRMVCVREIETERWLWVVALPVESKVGVSGDWLLEQWWFVWKGLPPPFLPLPPSLSHT